VRQSVIIYADFTTTEWEWICHYIINIKVTAKHAAAYTYIMIEEERKNDVIRLLTDIELEDAVSVVATGHNVKLHDTHVIIYGSEAKGFCSIYCIIIGEMLSKRSSVLNNYEVELLFAKLFVDIDTMYQSPNHVRNHNTLSSPR
jgi:hypothetical protein